ncbi:cobamide remodeling phosphodiesterase CbiR [Desulfoluna spongiiphila]|uniref:cobamide remodeling phosphodiesterase CbiR n=1 Tax=Desulfoluna spongiiphila TaxID=419481 RepID=UPI001250E7A2|nr:cobamide remodeling phosphodiesterase CbiR [Desulfoluna spongiiphila]VVS90461.1 xylose isomerase-like superfamily [Desulfoluna spongiiphila]
MESIPTTSYKNRFPFSLTVPSWLYPAGYEENVARVAPFVDGVELLFFEGRPESLPVPETFRALAELRERHGLSYNIHMPIDENLASADGGERARSLDAHKRLFELVAPFEPVTHTIHLEQPKGTDPAAWTLWACQSLEALAGVMDPSRVTVETLDYDLLPLADTLESLEYRVCLDLGHLIHFGLPVEETIRRLGPLCRMVHLHGVAGGKDHRALSLMDPALFQRLLPFLSTYTHTLSMEIFKAAPCFDSIDFLAEHL